MEKDQKRAYTIGDIADGLGVSKTTVSRAISGKGRLSRETRERVLAFAEEHDYRPNVQARGLAKSRTYNLGLIFPNDYAVIDFPFFKECMSGIYETALAYNYDIIISIEDNANPAANCRLADNHKVDGVILSRSASGDATVQKYLMEKKVPFVVIGKPDLDGVIWVDNQNREGSRELTELLLMKGFRNLALLGGNRAHLVTKSRLQGFLDAYYQYGLEPDPALQFFEVDSYDEVVKSMKKILKSGVDGIVCMDDFITDMLLGYLREKKIRVPEDMKLASMYDNPRLESGRVTVTSVRYDTTNLGRRACIALLKQLGEQVESGGKGMLNYQLILRESTK